MKEAYMNAYRMEKTPKILTLIGLVLEGLAAFSSLVSGYLLMNFDRFAFLEEMYASIEEGEQWIFDLMTGVIGGFVLGLGIVLTIMFVVNYFLFSKMMKGRFTQDTAKKVYKYQIIWGILSLLMNTLTGILYLVSGFQGLEKMKSPTKKDEVY